MRSSAATTVMLVAIAHTLGAQSGHPVVGPPTATIGHWRACLVIVDTRAQHVQTPNAVCGDIEASPDTFADISGPSERRLGLKVRHSLNLGSLFNSSPWPSVGGVTFVQRDSATVDSTGFRFMLGALGGADNGSVLARVAWTSPEVLQGTWMITCYSCEGAEGTITLRRSR